MTEAPRNVTLLSDGVVGLRRPEPADGPYYWSMRNNLSLVSSVMGFRLGVSEQTIDAWIAAGGGVSGDDLMLTAVLVPEAHRPIGYVKAFRVDRYSRHAWLGLSLFHERDAGHGYGRRMLQQVSDYLRDHLAIRKISLEALAINENALALYRKMGFVEEGRLVEQHFTGGRFVDVVLLSRMLASA
jgi:RimJ/RimL family protein N-acetyltransferase